MVLRPKSEYQTQIRQMIAASLQRATSTTTTNAEQVKVQVQITFG